MARASLSLSLPLVPTWSDLAVAVENLTRAVREQGVELADVTWVVPWCTPGASSMWPPRRPFVAATWAPSERASERAPDPARYPRTHVR